MSADRRSLLSARQLPGSEVLRIVEKIRALVVGRYRAAAYADGTMPRAARDRALSTLRPAVERALRATFIRASGPLENLPPSALSLVCDYLAHGEIVALSQTSRRLHDHIRAYLTSLADTNRETPTAAPYLFGCGWVRNGHAERRTVIVDIRNPELRSDFGEAFDVLTGTMSLVQYLSLALTWNPIIENGFLRALSEPAPHIESFILVVHPSMVDISSGVYTLPEIGQDLFASSAPSLTRCSLHGVELSPASSTAFQAVTCFDYSPSATVTITEISRILVLMPRLQTLGLMVTAFRALSDDVLGSSEATTHSTLRNVLLWTRESCALPWIPQFQGVTNVALVGSAVQAFGTLPFRTPHGACLRYWHSDALVFARLDSSDLDICFRLHPNAYVVSQVTAYPLTWLCIDEYAWPDNDATIRPAMNTLDTLTVTFAPCFIVNSTLHHAGLFATAYTTHGAPDTRWIMPRLRELRVSTAPWRQDSPQNHVVGCHCARMTVSLHDIAALIQHSMSFEAPKLETVVLAGLAVIDYDFASAWSNLMRFTGRIDMEEERDTRYAFCIPGTPCGLVGVDLEKYFAM